MSIQDGLPLLGDCAVCWFSCEGGVGYIWKSSRLVGPPVSGTVLVARLEPRMGIFVSSNGLGPPGGVGT